MKTSAVDTLRAVFSDHAGWLTRDELAALLGRPHRTNMSDTFALFRLCKAGVIEERKVKRGNRWVYQYRRIEK